MLPIKRKITRKNFPPHTTPGINWNGEVLRIRTIKKAGDNAKFAIVASKKLYNSKVSRNRFKRRVFFEVSQHLHKFDSNPHGYFIIFPLIHTEKISFSLIKKDIENFINIISR